MHRNCGDATIGVPELLVRTALADLPKTQPLQKCHDLTRLEDRWLGHASRHDGLDADELSFELRFAILKEESDHFLQVAVELVERCGRREGGGPPEAEAEPVRAPEAAGEDDVPF